MKNRGFSLVELLCVIIIVGLISLVIFPNIISSFLEASNKLDNATKLIVVEAAKDYYANNRNNIDKLDYCVNVATLQNEGLLAYDIKDSDGKVLASDILVKIYKGGSKYVVDEKCVVSSEEIKNAAKAYYNDGNIAISNGSSACITILALQNSYYLSKNISNGSSLYDTNTSLKITNNGVVTVTIGESC